MATHDEAGGRYPWDAHNGTPGQDGTHGQSPVPGQESTFGQDDYDLDVFARGVVRESEDDGIGLRPEKHAAPMLRLYTRSQGRPWLCWGGVTGGEEDADGHWFELYYHGMLKLDGGVKFGYFTIRVEGEGLEPLRHQMARHLRTTLRVGRTANHDHPIVVTNISITRLEFEDVE